MIVEIKGTKIETRDCDTLDNFSFCDPKSGENFTAFDLEVALTLRYPKPRKGMTTLEFLRYVEAEFV